MKAVFDTNTLIDYLQGEPRAKEELGRFSNSAISIATWAEVLIGAAHHRQAEAHGYRGKFEIVAPSLEIAGRSATIRRKRDASLHGGTLERLVPP